MSRLAMVNTWLNEHSLNNVFDAYAMVSAHAFDIEVCCCVLHSLSLYSIPFAISLVVFVMIMYFLPESIQLCAYQFHFMDKFHFKSFSSFQANNKYRIINIMDIGPHS